MLVASPVPNLICIYVRFRRIINDSLRTDVSLLYPPYMISLGMVFLLFMHCLAFVECRLQYLLAFVYSQSSFFLVKMSLSLSE